MERQTTIAMFAEQYGKNPDSVMVSVRRKFGTGHTLLSVLTNEQYGELTGKQHRQGSTDKVNDTRPNKGEPHEHIQDAKPNKNHKPKTQEIEKQSKPFAFVLFSYICLAIVIAHALLIWHSALMWGRSGFIGGAIIFLIQVAAVSISSVSEKNRTSEFALFFVCLIDIAAWFIHYPAFIQENSAINPLTTGFACAFLCASSFTALYLYRDSKLD